MIRLIAGMFVGALITATLITSRAQTTDTSWRYDFDGNGAVTIGDVIAVLPHVGETYTLPGPCHRFVPFATPVVLGDGTTMDGYFADDLTLPPSRDYLTC